MDIIDTAHSLSRRENPLTAAAAGKMFTMALERHATVRERGAGAAARRPRGGGEVARHRRFADEDEYGASTALEPAAGRPAVEEEE